MAIVYKITNKTTGRGYIGQTVRTIEQRWKAHCSSVRQGSKFRFHSAIRKYGYDDWDFEVLEENDDIQYIRQREIELIEQHEYQTKGVGYNAKPGGCGGWIVPPEKYKQWLNKQQNISTGILNGRYCGLTDKQVTDFIVTELKVADPIYGKSIRQAVNRSADINGTPKSFSKFRFPNYEGSGYNRLASFIKDNYEDGDSLVRAIRSDKQRESARHLMTKMLEKRYSTDDKN